MKRFTFVMASLLALGSYCGAGVMNAAAAVDDAADVSYNLADHIALSIPAALEANPVNTKTPMGSGMTIFEIALDNEYIVTGTNCGTINLYYSASADSQGDLLSSVDPADGGEVAIMGSAFSANGIEGGELDFQVRNYLYLLFNTNPALYRPETDFQRDGYYTLVIPTGALVLNEHPLEGVTIKFHYLNEIPTVDMQYVLTPAANDEVTDVNVFMTEGIRVEFPKANSVDYKKKGGGSLVGPHDLKIPALTPVIDYAVQPPYLIYKFGYGPNSTSPTEWENGQYTFTIEPGFLMIDNGYFIDEEEGNFKGLEVTYILNDPTLPGSTNVTLVGTEAAESYDVYTLDGKVVALGVAPENMGSLGEGIYIINGKKVKVRK